MRAAAAACELIVDANEGWNEGNLAANLAACAAGRRRAGRAAAAGRPRRALADIKRPIPVCADESVHDRASLAALAGKYDAVNIKLDKAGGLTEALAMAAAGRQLGFAIMAGCMVATSLAMAPAMLLAQPPAFVDLDGPLLLAATAPTACATGQPGLPAAAGPVGLSFREPTRPASAARSEPGPAARR